MRLLLDTHIWLWSVMVPEKLGSRVRRALTAAECEAWLSPISTWETLVLARKGRIELADDPDEWLVEAHRRAPTREAVLTHDIAAESRRVALPHEDPADRFLVATARVLDLVLVTADTRILRSKPCNVLPNR